MEAPLKAPLSLNCKELKGNPGKLPPRLTGLIFTVAIPEGLPVTSTRAPIKLIVVTRPTRFWPNAPVVIATLGFASKVRVLIPETAS